MKEKRTVLFDDQMNATCLLHIRKYFFGIQIIFCLFYIFSLNDSTQALPKLKCYEIILRYIGNTGLYVFVRKQLRPNKV